MRIISQNGAIDVTYENADLERKGTIISVWTLDSVYGSFASYSTEEKAIKAMEMCREYYDSIFFEPQSEIFQFPEEEEVE